MFCLCISECRNDGRPIGESPCLLQVLDRERTIANLGQRVAEEEVRQRMRLEVQRAPQHGDGFACPIGEAKNETQAALSETQNAQELPVAKASEAENDARAALRETQRAAELRLELRLFPVLQENERPPPGALSGTNCGMAMMMPGIAVPQPGPRDPPPW